MYYREYNRVQRRVQHATTTIEASRREAIEGASDDLGFSRVTLNKYARRARARTLCLPSFFAIVAKEALIVDSVAPALLLQADLRRERMYISVVTKMFQFAVRLGTDSPVLN